MIAVLQWLQRISGRSSATRSILITCRSAIIAASPVAVAIEVPTFTTAESGELIMNIMNRKFSTEDEVWAANELSEKLGGLALAIDIIAEQIQQAVQDHSGFSAILRPASSYLT